MSLRMCSVPDIVVSSPEDAQLFLKIHDSVFNIKILMLCSFNIKILYYINKPNNQVTCV